MLGFLRTLLLRIEAVGFEFPTFGLLLYIDFGVGISGCRL